MKTHLVPSKSFLLSSAIAFSVLSISPVHAKASESFKGAVYEVSNGSYIDFRGISTLGELDRIVAEDRWDGINAADVLREFSKFNGVNGSPALREIWRNVLLGDFSGLRMNGSNEQARLMAERLRILNRLGFFDEAVRLYQQAAGKKAIPETMARQGVESLALSGSADGTCLEVLMASKYLAGSEWTQNAALCAAYFNDDQRANALYEQVGKEAGSGFRAVFKAIQNRSGGSVQPNIPALWRTLLLASGANLSPQTLGSSDAMTLAAISANPKVPLGTRLAAASRAADYGTVGTDRLRKLYEAKSDSAQPGSSQSDLYSQARFVFEGQERAAIVRKAMRQLNPVTNVKGHTFTWIVDKLTLQVDRLGWFAPYGYSLMMATNRLESAQMYYESGKLDQSPFSIIHAIQSGKPWSKAQQEAWKAAMISDGKAKSVDKTFLLVKSFDQEGKLALNKYSVVRTDETKPLSLLQDSLRKGGRGLTLITAVNYLAKAKQLSAVQASEAAEIIRVLTKEGLFGERKKIALEILLQTVL